MQEIPRLCLRVSENATSRAVHVNPLRNLSSVKRGETSQRSSSRSTAIRPPLRMSMTTEVDFLLIGGGLASATAAKILREQGAEGTVVILAAEPLLPYHRPPLTKSFLLGKRSYASLLV